MSFIVAPINLWSEKNSNFTQFSPLFRPKKENALEGRLHSFLVDSGDFIHITCVSDWNTITKIRLIVPY